MKQSIILAVQIILWTAFLSFDASAQLGFQNPFFVAAELKSAAGGCATPNAPSNCNVDDANDPPQHTVTWNDPSGSFDGIEVWAAIDGGSSAIRTGGIAPGSASPGFGQWEDLGAAVGDGHVYIYKVRATNACGTQSAFSNTVTNDIFVDAVNYWTLNEASGNRADSVGGNTLVETASIVISAVASGTGIKGNAASLVPATGSFLQGSPTSYSGAFSVVLWVNVRSLPASMTKSGLWFDGGDAVDIYIQSDGNLDVGNGDGTLFTPSLGSLNAWHCLVYTASGAGTVKFSIDGGTFSSSASSDYDLSATPFAGAATPLVPDALIDEPCYFLRVLSQAEATSIATGRFK